MILTLIAASLPPVSNSGSERKATTRITKLRAVSPLVTRRQRQGDLNTETVNIGT